MGKTSTKLAVYALVQLLLFHLSGLVRAVSFHFDARADYCAGPALAYLNVGPYRCASSGGAAAGSLAGQSMSNQVAGFYGGGRCCFLYYQHGSRGCAVGGGYTGASWYPSREPCEADKACNAQAKPTGISYLEESTEGLWILTTDNVTEMYTQMDTILDAQKVNWLQAHGASFQPGLSIGTGCHSYLTCSLSGE